MATYDDMSKALLLLNTVGQNQEFMDKGKSGGMSTVFKKDNEKKLLLSLLGVAGLAMPRPAGTNAVTNVINNLALGSKMLQTSSSLFPKPQTAYEKKVDDTAGDIYKNILERADRASQNLQTLSNVRLMYDKLDEVGDVGRFGQFRGEIEQWGRSIGIENLGLSEESNSWYQALDKIHASLSMDALANFKGAISDKELAFVREAALGPGMSSHAFDIKYNMDVRMEQLARIKADALQQFTEFGKFKPTDKRMIGNESVGFDTYFKMYASQNGFNLEDSKEDLIDMTKEGSLKDLRLGRIRVLSEDQYKSMEVYSSLDKLEYYNTEKWKLGNDGLYEFQWTVKDGKVQIPERFLTKDEKNEYSIAPEYERFFNLVERDYAKIKKRKLK